MFIITLDGIDDRLPFKQIGPQISGFLLEWPFHDLMDAVEVSVARRERYNPKEKESSGHPKISACYKATVLLIPGSDVPVQDADDSIRGLDEVLRERFGLSKSVPAVSFVAEASAA